MKPRELGAFLLITFLFGSSFLWTKIATRELLPFTIATGRLFFGCVSLAIYLLAVRQSWRLSPIMYVRLAILGVLNNGLPFILMSWGEQRIDSSMAAALEATMPILTAVMAHFLVRGERLTRRRVLGVSIAFLGTLVLLGRSLRLDAVSGSGLAGQAALLGASLCYALASVYASRAVTSVSASVKTFFSMLAALGVTGAGALAWERPLHLPTQSMVWIAIVFMGVLGSCVALMILYWLFTAIGPSRTMLIGYTMPVVGVALGVLLLGERLDWNLGIGCVVVIMGIAVFGR